MITIGQGARALAALAGTALLLAAIAAGSAAPVPLHPGETGRLRLSWSARPERIETCRNISREEQAELEEHMRQQVECEGHSASYALEVRADGRAIGSMVVRGAGLRHDRPIYLLREFEVPAGMRHIHVSFTRRERATADSSGREASDSGISAGREEREAVERARRGRAAIPARLVLDTSLTIVPRGVTVVTLSQERRELELLRHDGH